jgi:lipopolysaccharide/colanic/teichoic acid biosynthesis glycosyltransferase
MDNSTSDFGSLMMLSEYNSFLMMYALFPATYDEMQMGVLSQRRVWPSLRPDPRRVERALDVFLAVLAVMITLPLIATVAAALKLVSPSQPLLERECRIGKDGRMFHLYRFHCAAVNTDKLHQLIEDILGTQRQQRMPAPDPLALQLAQVIRSAGLDYLPMLFNVIKGDISLLHAPTDVPWMFTTPVPPPASTRYGTPRMQPERVKRVV